MSYEKKYVISFFTVFLLSVVVIFGLVTWMNPDRTINMPWGIDFISDRNMPYKKFTLLKNNTSYTDLILGSSTSETMAPANIEKLYNIKAYLGGVGGSRTPLKLSQVNHALKNNPNLERIIYVVDLFEFSDTHLDTQVYYQDEIMSEINLVLREKLKKPDAISRLQDVFSNLAISNSIKALKDYKQFKKGSYKSKYLADGTTGHSMVQFNPKENINTRVAMIANAYNDRYGNMEKLDPLSIDYIQEIINTAQAHQISLVFVIAPFHTLFYKYFEADFEKHNDLYQKYVEFMRSLAQPGVQIVDYSYPLSIEKGILDDKEYWHDGIHFSHKSAEIIMNEIYKNSQDRKK